MQTRPIQLPRHERRVGAPTPLAPRLLRFGAYDIAAELPAERVIRIDVNGCLAGAVRAVPDAPRELAVGWAFLHGFIDDPASIGHVTVCDDRVSLMVEGAADPDELRPVAAGWIDAPADAPVTPAIVHTEPLMMTEAQLFALAAAGFRQFRDDDASSGYVHAAVATAGEVLCVARDLQTDQAVAKVIGWALLDDGDRASRVLITRGIVGQTVDRAAARAGLSLVITDALPTPEGMAARELGLSLVGMARSRTIGLLIDGGHIVADSEASTPKA